VSAKGLRSCVMFVDRSRRAFTSFVSQSVPVLFLSVFA
jgi:hypothetical protein